MSEKAKEHPILFSTEMVKAILEGRKTQTRRVCKASDRSKDADSAIWCVNYMKDGHPFPIYLKECPFGSVGSTLWVRETWMPFGYVGNNCMFIHYKASEAQNGGERIMQIPQNSKRPEASLIWKPSIFIPRWASRITLEITDIRVQRLQDITEEDAIAEGITFNFQTLAYVNYLHKEGSLKLHNNIPLDCNSLEARDSYHTLWDKINGKKYPWSSNPWLWVITFKEVTH